MAEKVRREALKTEAMGLSPTSVTIRGFQCHTPLQSATVYGKMVEIELPLEIKVHDSKAVVGPGQIEGGFFRYTDPAF